MVKLCIDQHTETNGAYKRIPTANVRTGKRTVFAEHDKVKQFETILAIVQEKAAKGGKSTEGPKEQAKEASPVDDENSEAPGEAEAREAGA